MSASRPLPETPEPAAGFAVAGPTEALDGAVALVVEGELDIATAPELAGRLLLAEAAAARVLVDLRGVEFMDSTGLAALMASRERHRERGAVGPGLVVVDGQVRRVLELTGCADMIEDAAALG
jgi:anti-sigma B factor antagonist